MEENEIRALLEYIKEQGKDDPIRIRNEKTQRLILASTNLLNAIQKNMNEKGHVAKEDIKAEYDYLLNTISQIPPTP